MFNNKYISQDEVITIDGKIQKINTEFTIITPVNGRYQPINLKDKFKKKNLLVRVTGTIIKDKKMSSEWAIPFLINEIYIVKENTEKDQFIIYNNGNIKEVFMENIEIINCENIKQIILVYQRYNRYQIEYQMTEEDISEIKVAFFYKNNYYLPKNKNMLKVTNNIFHLGSIVVEKTNNDFTLIINDIKK